MGGRAQLRSQFYYAVLFCYPLILSSPSCENLQALIQTHARASIFNSCWGPHSLYWSSPGGRNRLSSQT